MTKLYTKVQTHIVSRKAEVQDEGATMVEYGLIVAAIALIVVIGATFFGNALSTFFVNLAGKL